MYVANKFPRDLGMSNYFTSVNINLKKIEVFALFLLVSNFKTILPKYELLNC